MTSPLASRAAACTRNADGNKVAAWMEAASGSALSMSASACSGRPANKCASADGDVGVHYLVWLSEFGQLSARFLKQ